MANMTAITFRDFWYGLKPGIDREQFAVACSTTVGYMNGLATGHKTFSARLAIEVERESGGQVRVEVSCPKADWEVIRGKPAFADPAAAMNQSEAA